MIDRMGKHLLAAFVFMLALALFGLGYAAGNRGPDISPQVDTLILRSARTDTAYVAVTQRQRVVERVTDSLEGVTDTLYVPIREALPDSLRPVLDSLRAAQAAVALLWRGQAEAWRAQALALQQERNDAIALLRLRVKKPFPVQIVAGVALTTQGLLPAIGIGLRIPLPKFF